MSVRTVPAERAVAGFDSATATVRATAAALRGERFVNLGQGRSAGTPLRLSRWLPGSVRKQIYRVSGAAEGVETDMLGSIDMNDTAGWLAGHYQRTSGRFPGVMIGSSNGAATHLCAAAEVPWLPGTVLVPVRWKENDPDRPEAAMRFGCEMAPALLARNPDVALHHMHDGNQDRLMISRMSYFRLKWLRLPPAYEEFLATRLEPGAPIVLVDCGLRWPVTRVAERHVFQTGAYGGLRPEDYLVGSEEVERFLAEQKSPVRRFDAPPADESAPEAEWGLAPEFGAAVVEWGRRHGHPVHRVSFAGPHGLSAPVADLHRQWLAASGRATDRLLVESFVMLDPVGANAAGMVPYWTAFPVRQAFEAVLRYARERCFRDVEVLLFPHGVRSVGIAGPDTWLALHEFVDTVHLPATDRERYPADFRALTAYSSALDRLVDQAGNQSGWHEVGLGSILDGLRGHGGSLTVRTVQESTP